YRSILDVDEKHKNFEGNIFNFLLKDGLKRSLVKEMPVSAESAPSVEDCYRRLKNAHKLRRHKEIHEKFAKAMKEGNQNLQILSAFCVEENEKENVLNLMSEFEKQIALSQELIDKALKLNSYEFTALISNFYLQIVKGKVRSLRQFVERFYSKNIMADYVPKGVLFEQIIKELLRHIYPSADIEDGKRIKNEAGEEYEYDFIVTNSGTEEIVVVEAKGYESRKQIPLGVFSQEKKKFEKETVKWFFNQTFPFFKKNYPNPRNYQFKACYVTSAGFTEEALRYLTSQYGNTEKPHGERPSALDMYYSRDELLNLLSRKGLTQEVNRLKQYWESNN
ncbi:MAG TPA: hypothetical protein VNI02_00150, partial [Blastocatellia bacterium]|nr:hypothetical protein [Blastocatellia bacterium]